MPTTTISSVDKEAVEILSLRTLISSEVGREEAVTSLLADVRADDEIR
jgi:hypothetical protein